jgi:GNAT superfamily N-acetyltransferase
MTELRIQVLTGSQIIPLLSELAHLRIEVFKEYPYLYDGSVSYEKTYLKSYADCPKSLVVAAFYGDLLVGASTGLPMEDAADEFKHPFEEQGFDVAKIFYFGESVMKKAYRGTGIYARFFAEREGYARGLNRFDQVCFCAVERPEDHPEKPSGYRPLDAYWEKHGYEKHPELVTQFLWKDLDEKSESPKPMVFWLKKI